MGVEAEPGPGQRELIQVVGELPHHLQLLLFEDLSQLLVSEIRGGVLKGGRTGEGGGARRDGGGARRNREGLGGEVGAGGMGRGYNEGRRWG